GNLTIGTGQTFTTTNSGNNGYQLQINPTITLAAGTITTFNTASANLLLGSTGAASVNTLSGTGTLVKTGGNRMTLFQAATAGSLIPAIINAGVLEVRSINGLSPSAASPAPVTLNGGTLDIRRDSVATYNMDVTVNANSTINVQSADNAHSALTL